MIEKIEAQLAQGAKIKEFNKSEASDGLVTYDFVFDNKAFFLFSLHIKGNPIEIGQIDDIVNNKSNHVDTPPPPQKDAPFYQGMTKTETVESLIRCIYRALIPAEHFLTKNKVFVHEDIVVIEGLIEGKNKGYQQFCKYDNEGKFWTIEDSNNPKELAPLASEEHQHQKHLMEKEAQRKKEESEMKAKAQFKEQERIEERFKEMEAKYLEGIKDVGYHLDWLKDMKLKNPNWYKDHVRREYMELNFGHHICQISAEKMRKEAKELLDKVDNDITNSLDKSGEDMECPNDGLLALIKQMYPNTKCIWLGESELEPELTAQDLIQAAKDELMHRVKLGKTPAHNVGFVYCIEFMEETMGKDPYKN